MVRLSQNKSNICTWPVTLFINSHLRFAFQLKLLSRKLESVLHKTISSCEELVGDTSTIPCSIQIIPIKHLHLCGKKQKFRLFFFFFGLILQQNFGEISRVPAFCKGCYSNVKVKPLQVLYIAFLVNWIRRFHPRKRLKLYVRITLISEQSKITGKLSHLYEDLASTFPCNFLWWPDFCMFEIRKKKT